MQIIHLPFMKNTTCLELKVAQIYQEHNYYTHNYLHPITATTQKFIVGDRFHDSVKSGHKKITCKFHNIDLCPELKSFQSITSEVINSRIKSVQLKSSSQQNLRHYFIYNRLMDYWRNITIVQKQYQQMALRCTEGEYKTRDPLHRFIFKRK